MPFRAFALLALLTCVTLGCNQFHTGPPCLFNPAADAGQLSAPVGLPGRIEEVQIPIPARVLCRSVTFPTGAEVTVVDPSNLPVEVKAQPFPSPGSGPLTFSFVPQLPGPYHVTARFEPDFGNTQTDVQIAVDRTDAGVIERPMPFECARFEIAQGVDFCLDPDAGQLVTVVGGQAVSRVDAWGFAQAPTQSGVWVAADGGATQNWVRLYTLDGGALDLAFEQAVPWSTTLCPTCGVTGVTPEYATLKARDNRLLLLDPPHLLELAFDGGEVSGNDLATFDLPPILFVQWGPSGSVAAWAGNMGCVLPFDGGACTALGSEPLAADDELLWTYEPSSAQLAGFGLPLDGGRPVDVRIPVSSPDISPLGPALFFWSVGSDTAVARFEGGEVSLEAFALPLAGAAHSGVEPSRLWRWDPDDGGVIRYVER